MLFRLSLFLLPTLTIKTIILYILIGVIDTVLTLHMMLHRMKVTFAQSLKLDNDALQISNIRAYNVYFCLTIIKY